MSDPDRPYLNIATLTSLARQCLANAACPHCASIRHATWESLHTGFDAAQLRVVGTLRAESYDEPTFAEHHPHGSHSSSADAPIAPAFFPYNRCDVWQCTACRRAFLRYTEYGGYYQDARIRALDPQLIDDTPL